MPIRVVYANPGDMLDIRIIDDAEAPRTNREWAEQIRPRKLLMTVRDYNHVAFVQPHPSIALTTMSGKTIKYL